MTIEEIRANAPKGATHYNDDVSIPDTVIYYKEENGQVMLWCLSEDWFPSAFENLSRFKPL